VKVAVFSAKPYDREFFADINHSFSHELIFLEPHLNAETAILAQGAAAVCVFVNDCVDRATLQTLAKFGIRLVALRCAGFNNVDRSAAAELGVKLARVPAYSPHAVAEHTIALMLALNRNIPRAHARVHEGNFSLTGLLGFDMFGKTAGIVGTGRIGSMVARLLTGFGCRVIASDVIENAACLALGVTYVALEDLLARSDIISLHCPLTPETRHLVNAEAIARMKPGAMLINTSRGAVVETKAVIAGLKTRKIGYLGIDVYEEEGDLFFEDCSNQIIQDDVFSRLLTFPNVLVTGHQAFFTREALAEIARVTLSNITEFERGNALTNEVLAS
jgi:D-lactate dehydrogenase